MNPAWRERARDADRFCASCRETGACLYGIDRLWFDDEGSAMAIRTVCPAGHQGGPGVAHGGWICSVMDELLGQNVFERLGGAVTANLNVDFRKPVSVGEPIVGTSWIESVEGRKIHVRGELRLEIGGALLATATALFILLDEGHHARHAEWVKRQKQAPLGAAEE